MPGTSPFNGTASGLPLRFFPRPGNRHLILLAGNGHCFGNRRVHYFTALSMPSATPARDRVQSPHGTCPKRLPAFSGIFPAYLSKAFCQWRPRSASSCCRCKRTKRRMRAFALPVTTNCSQVGDGVEFFDVEIATWSPFFSSVVKGQTVVDLCTDTPVTNLGMNRIAKSAASRPGAARSDPPAA